MFKLEMSVQLMDHPKIMCSCSAALLNMGYTTIDAQATAQNECNCRSGIIDPRNHSFGRFLFQVVAQTGSHKKARPNGVIPACFNGLA